MEFNAEFIEKNQLSDDQVNAINAIVDEHIKTELGTKVHEHTEENLKNIWNGVNKLTGIERDKGEKYVDAIKRATDLHFEGTKSTLERRQQELEDKIKNVKGDESLKKELEDTKELLKGLKQKEAEYDEWVKNDYKGKYEKNYQELSVFKQRIAFKENLPVKPEHVNKYEWDAKIKQFQTELLNKNNLVFDENETAWLVDKENEFKKTKLEDIVKQSSEIQELLKTEGKKGLGTRPKDIKIDGVPFAIPENATAEDRNKAIKEYLLNVEKISITDSKYAARFAELNRKLLGLEKNPETK